jgi:hypothetical protein
MGLIESGDEERVDGGLQRAIVMKYADGFANAHIGHGRLP